VNEKIGALTNGLGADLVVEASGAEPAIRQAFDVVRRNGKICALGITGRENVSIPWDAGIKKAVELKFSYSSSWTSWERALSIMATGKVNLDLLITHTFPLKEWEQAFELLKRMEAIKVLLIP